MLDFVAFFYVSHINASEKCFFAENENNFNMYANVYITNQQGRNEKKKVKKICEQKNATTLHIPFRIMFFRIL